MVLGQSLFFLGSHAEGIAEMKRALDLDPSSPFPLGWLGHFYGLSGRPDLARDMVRQLEKQQQTLYVQPYIVAIIYSGLGEKERALELLEKAVREHSDELIFAKVDPALDPLRSEPRFHAILKALHFEG